MAENDSAVIYNDLSFKISEKNKYTLGKAIALESKGLYHEIISGDYEKASNYYFQGIALAEENNLNYATSIYHSLGVMFHTSDNYDKAKEYYTIAYERALNESDLVLQKKCVTNLGTINSSQGNYDLAEKMLLESIKIPVREDINYSTYANLANLFKRKKEYSKALEMVEKAIIKHPDNYDSERNLIFLVEIKKALGDSTGIENALQRLLIEYPSIKSFRDKSLMARAISDSYKLKEDFKAALEYRDEYILLYEEVKSGQRDDTVFEMEAQYQNEKKQREIEKQQATKTLLLWIAGLVTILLAAVLFSYFKNKKKNGLLAKQKKMLEATIDEKNILLRETHHRVKNSFQMVSSLLFIQSETAQNKEAKLAIKEAQNRVRSMVLIHQKLYSKDQLVGIDSKEYIEDFTKDIIESHQFENTKIKYQINAEQLVLSIETITPIGLILNELITNVLKHAFKPVTAESFMQINLYTEQNKLILEVIDNGLGMPESIKDTSFGIELIDALSKKLKARLTHEKNIPKGTVAKVIMKRFEVL
ncbi:hypothetical protein ULMA_04580 [Patiriisocius marinus]|uniref:histidine kinase n=2 Tax=Patiriisocius marinus TaxID=1397112 RepID=A0A5J4IWX6_9FLAO|nr:hypothetical protein ULMA_04580 [Patiriisocius marinus]